MPTPIKDPNAPPDPSELRDIPDHQHMPVFDGQAHNPVPQASAEPDAPPKPDVPPGWEPPIAPPKKEEEEEEAHHKAKHKK